MQNGMTLPELALAMVLVGLLVMIGIPRYRETLDRIAVDRTAYTLVAAHHSARITAILESRPSLLRFTSDSVVIRVRRQAGTVLHCRGPGPAANGVALSGPTKSLVFSPTGLAMGFSNGTWVLRRGRALRKVITSRLGRARIVP
jgi:prepilin-type N-terminal cleavage/methylation domain-containing protein